MDEYLPANRTAVDVGAWWGPWTATMAKQCPAVHSFEPQPVLATQLRDWAPTHVTVYQQAVSDRPGKLHLSRPDHRPGGDGLATLRPTGDNTIEVDVTTIDLHHFDDVGFMKIDVEGFELPALKGAEQTLERCRPRLMIEIEQRHLDYPITDVFDWLTARRFQGWFLRDGRWIPLNLFDVEADQTAHVDSVKSASYINAFLFIPEGEGWRP